MKTRGPNPASRNDLEWSAAFFQGALMDDFSNGSHSERAIDRASPLGRADRPLLISYAHAVN